MSKDAFLILAVCFCQDLSSGRMAGFSHRNKNREDTRASTAIPLGNDRLFCKVGLGDNQLVLDFISKQLEEKKIIRSNQHGFTKQKWCSANLVAFYDVIWANEERTVDVVYFDLGKAFDTVSYKILVTKLRKCGINERTVRWVENWLADGAQSCAVVQSSSL